MKNIKKCFSDLTFLKNCNHKVRRLVIKHADKNLIIAITECLYNFLIGNVHVDNKVLKRLKKHKSNIRTLVDKKSCVNKKREILVQKGGFLPIILPSIIATITGLLK